MNELLEATAVEQSRRILAGEISAEQLTALYLERIAAHDPTVNAFTEVFERRALRQARFLDRARRSRSFSPTSPLWGVPIAIKDLDHVRCSHTRFGSEALRWVWSPFDGIVASRVRRGGMVILGKTTTSELGILPVTETSLQGATRNPWDTDRSSGGSSGGSGASVAARMVSIAHGSDGAGSIRIPAALNGLFGYKPSRDFLVDAYGAQDVFDLAVIGPLARSVEDLAALADLWRADESGPRLSDRLDDPPRGSRIRVLRDSPLGPVPDAFTRAVDGAARTLRDLGHEAVDGETPQGSLDEFVPIYLREFSKVPPLFRSKFHPTTRWFLTEGRKVEPAHAERALASIRRRAEDTWQDADFLLSPTTGMTAPPIGLSDGLPPREQFDAVAPLGTFTAAFNVTGQPALTVPFGHDADGLPLAVQLVARQGEDASLMALARQLWRAEGLELKAPPLGVSTP